MSLSGTSKNFPVDNDAKTTFFSGAVWFVPVSIIYVVKSKAPLRISRCVCFAVNTCANVWMDGQIVWSVDISGYQSRGGTDKTFELKGSLRHLASVYLGLFQRSIFFL